MKITIDMTCDVTAMKLAYSKSTGARVATMTVVVRQDDGATVRHFGEDFFRAVFGSLDQKAEPGVGRFGYREIKPSGVCEIHALTIGGQGPLAVQPEVHRVIPDGDNDEVEIEIRLAVEVNDKALAGSLAMMVGQPVAIELTPAQMELPLNGDEAH